MNEHDTGTLGTVRVPSAPSIKQPARLVPLAILWAALVATAGGFATGYLIVNFRVIGAIGLFGIGAIGGFISRKITGAACPLAAWILVVACVIAFGLAEVSWYHWTYDILDAGSGEYRPQTWPESFARTPKVLWEKARYSMAIAGIFAALGAQSAYWQAGKRYRLVTVAED